MAAARISHILQTMVMETLVVAAVAPLVILTVILVAKDQAPLAKETQAAVQQDNITRVVAAVRLRLVAMAAHLTVVLVY